jgi:uncharacterized protein
LLLCDTGVLLAAGNVKDHAHDACLALLSSAEGPLLVPSPVLGEVGYLLQSRVGPAAEVTFLQSFGDDGFHVAELADGDVPRMAELVDAYLDLPLGVVDAATGRSRFRCGARSCRSTGRSRCRTGGQAARLDQQLGAPRASNRGRAEPCPARLACCPQ